MRQKQETKKIEKNQTIDLRQIQRQETRKFGTRYPCQGASLCRQNSQKKTSAKEFAWVPHAMRHDRVVALRKWHRHAMAAHSELCS